MASTAYLTFPRYQYANQAVNLRMGAKNHHGQCIHLSRFLRPADDQEDWKAETACYTHQFRLLTTVNPCCSRPGRTTGVQQLHPVASSPHQATVWHFAEGAKINIPHWRLLLL